MASFEWPPSGGSGGGGGGGTGVVAYGSSGDTNATITANTGIWGVTALTATRTLSLPIGSSVTQGQTIIIEDESGNCSVSNNISIVTTDGSTISGQSSIAIQFAYSSARLYWNGSNWFAW